MTHEEIDKEVQELARKLKEMLDRPRATTEPPWGWGDKRLGKGKSAAATGGTSG